MKWKSNEIIWNAKKTASPPSANGAPRSVLGRIRMEDPGKLGCLSTAANASSFCSTNADFKKRQQKAEQPPGYLEIYQHASKDLKQQGGQDWLTLNRHSNFRIFRASFGNIFLGLPASRKSKSGSVAIANG